MGNVGSCLLHIPVDCRDGRVRRRKRLEIPVWWTVRVIEAVVGQKSQRWPLEPGGHDDNVSIDNSRPSQASLGNARGPLIHQNAGVSQGLDVTPDPVGLAGTDVVQDVRVDHGGIGKDALVGRGDAIEIPVEESSEEYLGEPADKGVLAQHVPGK